MKDFLKDKKVIIFDLDGTLVDSVGIWNELDFIMLKEMVNIELDRKFLQKQRENFINKNNSGNVYGSYSKFLIEKYKLPYNLEEVFKRRTEIADYLVKNIDYKKDADKVLKALKQKGYTLVLATITSSERINKYCNDNENLKSKARLDEIFDLILTTDVVKEKKPNPEVYLKALEMLNAKREDCLVVEDSLEGVTAAKLAGIEVLNIPDEYSKENQSEIDKISDYKIDNFSEFLKYI